MEEPDDTAIQGLLPHSKQSYSCPLHPRLHLLPHPCPSRAAEQHLQGLCLVPDVVQISMMCAEEKLMNIGPHHLGPHRSERDVNLVLSHS